MEILEGLCESSSFECNHMVEEYEEHFETWWFKRSGTELNNIRNDLFNCCLICKVFHCNSMLIGYRKTKYPDLHKWFCIETIKVCCIKGTFGSDCNCKSVQLLLLFFLLYGIIYIWYKLHFLVFMQPV